MKTDVWEEGARERRFLPIERLESAPQETDKMKIQKVFSKGRGLSNKKQTIRHARKFLYDAAVQLMREADDVETYRLAEKLFRRIPPWKDALEKANACQREQHEIREELDDEWKQFKAERRRSRSRRITAAVLLGLFLTVVTVALLHMFGVI